jgi:TPR repeat protein
MIQNFTNMNTNELGNTKSIIKQINENISSEKNSSIIVNEIVYFIFKEANKGNLEKRCVFDYLYNHNINSKEIYNLLLNNQNTSNFIFLLGYFNYMGIEKIMDYKKAFNLFINASERKHILAQYYVGECYEFGRGITKNEKLAFEYYEKVANKDYAVGQFKLGWFYDNGISVKKDLKIAVYWYEKAAANNEHIVAMHNLAFSYKNGDGVDKNHQKVFELFKKSAEGEYPDGIMMLGYCYDFGIGVNINKQKAIELYKKAASLGHNVAQYNLAFSYEKGEGIEKDLDEAIYWYEQSANQGNQIAQNRLKTLKIEDNLCKIS